MSIVPPVSSWLNLGWSPEELERPAYSEFIDYTLLSEWMVYGGERLALDHSMLVMEDVMWEQHQARMARFYETGRY